MSRPQGRPPVYDRAHWDAVARVYSQALAAAQQPTLAVADWFGVPKSTAAKWVSRCRSNGALPATTKGRAAGLDGSEAPERTAAQTIGAHVRVLRRARGWSQQDLGMRLADALGVAGWSVRQAVSAAEAGRRAWTADEIAAAAVVFGVKPGVLFEEPPECGTCCGQPPAGFTCNACGAEAGR